LLNFPNNRRDKKDVQKYTVDKILFTLIVYTPKKRKMWSMYEADMNHIRAFRALF